MPGYQPAGTLPDYIINPNVMKTWDEWMEIMYPNKRPWWNWLGRQIMESKWYQRSLHGRR